VPGQGIDTGAANPASQIQLNILIAVAEFERDIIRDGVRSGLRAAKARGVRLGRPETLVQHLQRVCALLKAGKNVSEISRELALPYSSAHKVVSAAR